MFCINKKTLKALGLFLILAFAIFSFIGISKINQSKTKYSAKASEIKTVPSSTVINSGSIINNISASNNLNSSGLRNLLDYFKYTHADQTLIHASEEFGKSFKCGYLYKNHFLNNSGIYKPELTRPSCNRNYMCMNIGFFYEQINSGKVINILQIQGDFNLDDNYLSDCVSKDEAVEFSITDIYPYSPGVVLKTNESDYLHSHNLVVADVLLAINYSNPFLAKEKKIRLRCDDNESFNEFSKSIDNLSDSNEISFMQGHPSNPGNGSTDYLPFSYFKTCQFSPGNHTVYLEMTVIDQNGTQKTMSTTKSIEAITYDDLKRRMNETGN